jgi:hypothetical protein
VLKRILVIGTALAVVVALGPISAFASGAKATTTATKTANTMKSGTHATARMSGHIANTVAVCGCGKVFVPNANTKYIEVNGKRYACCSDECHKMALADPAKAAKMADENMAKLMQPAESAPKPTN